jgi:hypothetical protein
MHGAGEMPVLQPLSGGYCREERSLLCPLLSLFGRQGPPARDAIPAYARFGMDNSGSLISTRIFAHIPYVAAIPVPGQQPAFGSVKI